MLRPTTVRAVLRPQQRCLLRGGAGASTAARRTLTSKQSPRLTQDFNLNKLNAQRRDYERNRTAFLTAGAVAGILSFIYTAWKLKKALDLQNGKEQEKEAAIKCDAPPIPTETFKTEAGEKRKVVVHDEEGNEVVPTGNSTVPVFPRVLELDLPGDQKQHSSASGPSSLVKVVDAQTGTEYTLVGLGMRTVTFIGIQVYLVGLYVATQDIAKLQHYLVKRVNPMATTLIPSEKDDLRKLLRDPKESEAMWTDMLQDAGCRTAFRISPVRDTDFHHLRDGFVRAIQARSQRDKAYNDEAFGAAMKDFKALFNRGSVPKKQEMLLCRGQSGELAVTYGGLDGGKVRREVMGTIKDERLSRLLWLNYLAGSKVASEEARTNIIEGVMEFVERPVGTVATQVL